MPRFLALFLLIIDASARHRLETTAATLRGGEGRWRKVKGGASSLRSSARAWADYLTGVNGTNVTIWATKKKLKKIMQHDPYFPRTPTKLEGAGAGAGMLGNPWTRRGAREVAATCTTLGAS